MNRFELLRYEKGLTRAELAARVGVSERTIRYIETDEVVKPSAATAKALADFYEISVAALLGVDASERVA
jgi:transcriptional regulator with XRE-family HTH domain